MRTMLRASLLSFHLGLLMAGTAMASPVLKAEVDVTAQVVTVGDMFDDPGANAAQPMFLAPAPGTSGLVSIADIRLAAVKAGVLVFDDRSATGVRVSRLATSIDGGQLEKLLGAELKKRGFVTDGVEVAAAYDKPIGTLVAAAVPDPVQLADLTYAADSGLFAARFQVAGVDQPLQVTGTITMMVEAPQLASTLAAGTILSAGDIVMRPMPLQLVQNANVATLDQLVGKQLQRQSRAGMVLKVSDVDNPQLIARSDVVTVYLHSGPLTLTVKGTALNAASLGEPVQVMNAMSKKIIRGIARADGAVEVSVGPTDVAGL